MKMLQSVLLLAFSAFASAQASTPTPPSLTYLYTLNCTLGTAISVGTGPKGTRTVIPITGGSFSGPKLSGKVLPIGADWSLTDSKGNFNANTRYQLQTNDGANIYIQTFGPTYSDGTIGLHMVFETGSAAYWWVNDIVAIGILHAGGGGVTIDGYQIDA